MTQEENRVGKPLALLDQLISSLGHKRPLPGTFPCAFKYFVNLQDFSTILGTVEYTILDSTTSYDSEHHLVLAIALGATHILHSLHYSLAKRKRYSSTHHSLRSTIIINKSQVQVSLPSTSVRRRTSLPSPISHLNFQIHVDTMASCNSAAQPSGPSQMKRRPSIHIPTNKKSQP